MSQPLMLILLFAPAVLVVGAVQFIREPRRLRSMALILAGAGLTLLALLVYADEQGWMGNLPVLLMVIMLIIPLLGYPVLTVFLLANGVTMVRRESRSLGNLLSLLAGLAMLLGPVLVLVLDTTSIPEPLTSAVLLLAGGWGFYFGAVFLVFLLSALAYRRVRPPGPVSHVIILGAGLVGGAGASAAGGPTGQGHRTRRRPVPARSPRPLRGRGSDEQIAEGVAMARYLEEHGVDRERILVEDRSANTFENLKFSLALIDEPDPSLAVVTSDYHVFRAALLTRALGIPTVVRGARTAFYFVPSAFLREFIAVCRQHLGTLLVLPTLGTLCVVGLAALELVLG